MISAVQRGNIHRHGAHFAYEPALVREEYDLARRYTHSLYTDLSEAEAQWRPVPRSSSIAWHLGHQAMVTHLLLRNLIAGEPSLNPHFDLLSDAARQVSASRTAAGSNRPVLPRCQARTGQQLGTGQPALLALPRGQRPGSPGAAFGAF